MAALNFPASPSNNDTYTANGLTYKYDSTDGVWNLEGTQAVAFARQTSRLSTTTSVGINTDDVDRKTLVGLGNSFNGLYVSNGVFLTDKVMTGNHYISTQFNGFAAGPITLNGVMTVDGAFVIL